MGHLFNPDFRYNFQIAGETAENAQAPGAVTLLDAYIMSSHINWLNVQVGQFKVYFDRSQINSTAAMQFAGRALVMDAFTANGINRRDVGITIMNDEEVYPINYYGSSPSRVGDFGLISYRVEQAGEDFEAQVLLVA
jgi:phosphate-selective porin